MLQLESAAVLRGVALLCLCRISPGGRGIFFCGPIVEVPCNYGGSPSLGIRLSAR
jgi:hypothetical protein